MRQLIKSSLFLVIFSILVLGQTSCEDWLDEQPLTSLAETVFWNSESDAILALTGVYRMSNVGNNSYNNEYLIMSSMTDDSGYKHGSVGSIYSGYVREGDGQVVAGIWNRSYQTIFKANYFLENIDKVEDIDAQKKAEMIAEVRFLRAYEYFYLSSLYGDVPLITNTLSIEVANNQTRNPLTEVQNFTLTELSELANDLPVSRPGSERGRIVKAAAWAIQGRLLMVQNKWSEAASVYEAIINLNEHIIDPRFKEIFEEEGNDSKENILFCNTLAGYYGNTHNQRNYHPDYYGGYSESFLYQNLIDDFVMTDGLPWDESPLYDPDNPFDNRDERLYESVFLPFYTEFRGRVYDPTNEFMSLVGATGYGQKKMVTEDYVGDWGNSGDDIIHVRYAEVLLSYLESKLEAGDNITQSLLDATINEVRGRDVISTAPVTETNRDLLREIVRRERRMEFTQERFIRYWDIRRWDIFMEVMNRKFYGMKITDEIGEEIAGDIETSGRFAGHRIVINKTGSVLPEHALLPIPIYEININPNLQQNPGY